MSDAHIGAAAPGTAQPPPALGAEDYRQLFDMARSDDAGLRDQATTLAQKLTPAEGEAFVAFQKQAHRQSLIDSGRIKPGAPESATLEHRDDNTLFGLPPETAVAMGIPVARALLGPGLTMTARAVAGTKAVIGQATPLLKYEFTKTTLEKMHVPTPLAMAAAMFVSGYRGNGKHVAADAPPAAAGPVAVEAPPVSAPSAVPGTASGGMPPPVGPPVAAAPAESLGVPPAQAVPAAAAPPAVNAPAPVAPTLRPHPEGGVWSPTRIASEVGIQARRQGVTLTPAEDATVQALVRDHGVLPKDAVATIAATKATPSGLKLSPEEATTFQALRTSGKSGAEAESAVLQMRKLTKKLKTPSGAQVNEAVRRRNTTGRWDEE